MKHKGILLLGLLLLVYLSPSKYEIAEGEFLAGINFISNTTSFVNSLGSLTAFYLMAWTSYTLLYKFYNKLPVATLVLLVLVALFVTIGARYFIQEILVYNFFGIRNYRTDVDFQSYILDNSYYAMLYGTIGVIFFFVQNSRFEKEQKKALILANEKAKLSLLRSQVNPHFLFNALNNIYAQVFQKSDFALPAIDKLSKMLRYSLYNIEDITTMEKEIAYIEDYIELEKMRYDYHINYTLDFPAELRSHRVPPFIFITFIENAFKHGVKNEKESPIAIKWFAAENGLVFSVKNKISKARKDHMGGIGISNVKERLKIIYGDNHKLSISNNDAFFSVDLFLNIER